MIEWNWKKLLAFLFPPKCVGCGELLPIAEGAEEIFCPFCRTAWEAGRLTATDRCLSEKENDIGCVSLVRYRPGETEGIPERLIYHIKHRDERRVFDYVACELTALLRQTYVSAAPDESRILLSYPPRSRKAIRKDGFDQARRLAGSVSARMGFPMVSLLLRVKKSSKEQKYLSAGERRKNATTAYRLRKGVDVKDKVIILFDDVYTTGSTLKACAELLTGAGAAKVFFVTVGRTARSGGESCGKMQKV